MPGEIEISHFLQVNTHLLYIYDTLSFEFFFQLNALFQTFCLKNYVYYHFIFPEINSSFGLS